MHRSYCCTPPKPLPWIWSISGLVCIGNCSNLRMIWDGKLHWDRSYTTSGCADWQDTTKVDLEISRKIFIHISYESLRWFIKIWTMKIQNLISNNWGIQLLKISQVEIVPSVHTPTGAPITFIRHLLPRESKRSAKCRVQTALIIHTNGYH